MSDGSGPLTSAQALDLIERTTDAGWFTGMQAQPDAQAVLNGMAAVAEASSEAVTEQVAACSIATAPTGRTGVSSITVSRAITTTTATIPKGYKVVDSRGVDLLSALDVSVAVGQVTILIPLVTMRQLDLVNNDADAFDDLLILGDQLDPILDKATVPVYDSGGNPLMPGYDPLGAFVAGGAGYVGSTPITKASMDWLSAHGDERGCHRQAGEDGEAYRLRVRKIPDAATPSAIQDAVHGAQGHLPDVYMVEPYRDQATDAARLALELVFADSLFTEDSYCDDGLGVSLPGKLPFRTLEAPDLRQGRAYFRQSVAGQISEPDGSGCYSDDAFCDDPAWGFPDVGLSLALIGSLYAVSEEARVKKAGGVQFDTYIENITRLDGVGEVVADPGGVPAFVLTPPVGKAWMVRQGLVTVGQLDPTTDAFRVALLFPAGGLADTGWISPLDGRPLRTFELEQMGYYSDQVIAILVLVKSSVSSTLRAVGTFWTTEMTL